MAKHYYISFNSVDYSEIYPMGSPIANYSQWEGTRVWREELEQIKIVRSNNITVFDALESYFTDKTKFDTEVEIEVWSGIRSTGAVYFKGLFSISDSELDTEFKNFSIKPRVNDDYFDISEKYDIKYEVDVGVVILEDEKIGYSIPTALSSSWTNGPITTGALATAFTTLIATGGSISTAVAPAGVNIAEASHILETVNVGDIAILEFASKSGSSDFYFDIIDSSAVSITGEGKKTVSSTGIYGWTITQGEITPSVLMSSSPGTTQMEFTMRTISVDSIYDNAGSKLLTFLETFVSDIKYMRLFGFISNVVSTFLNNDALPTGAPSTISTFMTANPNGNYVTEATTNELNNTLIGLLSVLFGSATKSYKLSFKEITDHLRDILQVYWFIDADGKLRFEHERYFVSLVTDSTPISAPSPSETDKHLLKYEKGVIASVEQFSWPQAANTDFVGKDILYNNFVTTIMTKSYTISQITTDIKYVIDNITEASDTGLGLYHCNTLTGLTGDDVYEIAYSTGALSSSAFPNSVYSWANLHENYWTYSRMSEDATMNGTAVTMDSSIRFLQQEGVRFFYSTAINPYTQINTDLTGGAPIQIRRDLDTDYVELQIAYDPYKLT